MPEFDPNQPGQPGKLFGLPYNADEAEIVILPVPWDVTSSYGSGSSNGPECILEASPQIDYSIPGIARPWELGIAMTAIDQDLKDRSVLLRSEAEKYIDWLENTGRSQGQPYKETLDMINKASQDTNLWVEDQSDKLLHQEKVVGVLGGEHSSPLGLITALSRQYDNFGILQIDAHMDLRRSYEGFVYSHASIMYNALKLSQISKLIQVGIRDYCEAEENLVTRSRGRVKVFFDQTMKGLLFDGKKWSTLCDLIIEELPSNVYISFDIDGLDPSLCPNTGTPVPGGLSFFEVNHLLKKLVTSGRKIIGFDLCEVAPGSDQWDGNVGARVLFNLCVYAGISMEKLKFDR